MTKTEFDKIFNEKLEELKATRDSKHSEYADESETFRNLKDGARILDIDPRLYAFTLMTKQYKSLGDIVSNPSFSLDLTWEKVQDIIIYSMLIYGLSKEKVDE